MRLLYELDDPKETIATELTPMCPALWRHRKKITIEHLSFKFQEYSQDCNRVERCEVLAEFLKKVCVILRMRMGFLYKNLASQNFFCNSF